MVVFRQPSSAEGRDPLLNDQPPHRSGQELANGANSGERPSCAVRKTTPATKIEVNVWDHAQQATKGCVSHHVDVPSLAVVADARDFGLINVQVLEKLVQPGFD